MVPVTELRS